MVTLSRLFFLEFLFHITSLGNIPRSSGTYSSLLWTIYFLDLCFWVTVWLASPVWGNSFVLVYNCLPSRFIWLNSISQGVLGYLTFFTSFNRCFLSFGSLSLWSEVTKEKMSFMASSRSIQLDEVDLSYFFFFHFSVEGSSPGHSEFTLTLYV